MTSRYLKGPDVEPALRAAAQVYGCEPDLIEFELDESSPGKPTIMVRCPESMKFDTSRHEAVEEAVKAVLPPDYAHCEVAAV